MWSEGGVFGGDAAPKELARHSWGASTDDRVSSSTSPSSLESAVVDLSLKSQVESSEAVVEGQCPSMQSSGLETPLTGKSASLMPKPSEIRRLSSDDEGGRLIIVEPVPESSGSSPPPTEQKDFTSVKEVLLEMTNRKNGHTKLPPVRWGIMKKDTDQVPKYVVDEKKGFPRPTAFVNPFPADISPPNGSGTLQTSIRDWLQGKKELLTKEMNKAGEVSKMPKVGVRQRTGKGLNGKIITSRKKPLTTIVAQLTGSIQCSQSSQADPGILQKLLAPPESVSFSSSHHFSGGEVSISEVTPDISVVDRLKKLGTVIEIEDKGESNSLKLLEKMTKSVASDVDRPKSPIQTLPPPSKLAITKQSPSIHRKVKHISQTSKTQNSKNHSVPPQINNQLIPLPSEVNLTQVPLEHPKLTSESGQNQSTKMSYIVGANPSANLVQNQSNSPINQPSKVQVSSQTSNKIQVQSNTPKVSPKSQTPMKTPPFSSTPKVNLSIQKASKKQLKPTKHNVRVQQSKMDGHFTPVKQTPPDLLSPVVPVSVGTTLYISKDVTLIPKLAPELVHDKIEPSLLEPVIDIVEEENILTQDGTFLFKTDSFFSVDLPNEQKVYSCDICSAVYTHSNMLRKHYLRLHISRKYISEKDMETFNIDPEPVDEKNEEKLVFRCHTCRECFPTKNDLRSHLTDHPPVVELAKQNNKSHPIYKCENCSSMFKWRKQFGKHKKACKPSPPPPSEKPDLFHCLYCNETFMNGNSKRNHILSNHPYVRRKHCCVFCKRDGFPTNVSLFHHLLMDHPSVYFACEVCKERFTNLEELKSHTEWRHEQDDRLKTSVSERVSTLKQEKDYYSCDSCQRKFLIESSFKEHTCFPEKQEKPKPKLQKIKKKVYPLSERLEKNCNRNIDLETLFYSRVAGNVRDNLLNYLDGKIYKEESSDQDENYGAPSPNVSTRTFLNFSAGFPSSSEIQMEHNGTETPTRTKAPWEKYTFPKNYDGRCGLTSYIKDTSYLDISTQLIMRRNLQRLNMLPMKELPPDDVPSVLALERLGAECAESFGQLKEEKKEDKSNEPQELVSLSGEWVRERMYVCSVCRWESPCLWTMEDHKYLSHPRVHCPQHELIGEQTSLSKTIYKRLITEVPNPYKGPIPPSPPAISSISCTKCSRSGFSSHAELHIHILECAGVVVEAIGPIGSSRRRRRRTRRRPRRGLKRNIPSTPQKLPPKQRTKPGDTDTIQRMIANLPAKRVSRKVFSGYEDDNKLRQNIHKNATVKGGKNKKSTSGKRSQSEPPSTAVKEHPEQQMMLQRPTVIKKEQDYIDTSAEGGDVLSSLRMMPVRTVRAADVLDQGSSGVDKKDVQTLGQSDEKEMPKLEIEKDISPVESTEIPVLSPVERKDDIKKEKDDLICGISFVDGVIKYETVSSVSQETEKLDVRQNQRKRKSSSSSISPNQPKAKKACKIKEEPQIANEDISPTLPLKETMPKKAISKKDSLPKESKKEVTPKKDSLQKDVKKEILPKTNIRKSTSAKKSAGKGELSKHNPEVKVSPIKEIIGKKEHVVKKDSPTKKAVITKDTSPKKSSTKKGVEEEVLVSSAEKKEGSPKRRGRPKGSATRKLNISQKRRSNRRSIKNVVTEVKFDEILPFEEDEEVVKKPEKPKRKPRTVKEPASPIDSTTIIVQAEVHAPPALKRKVMELSQNTEDDQLLKKVKETEAESLPTEIDKVVEEDKVASECILQNHSSMPTTDKSDPIRVKSVEPEESTCRNDVSEVEPDKSVVEYDDNTKTENKDLEKSFSVLVETEEATVTTSVSDSLVEIVNDNQKESESNDSKIHCATIKTESIAENLISEENSAESIVNNINNCQEHNNLSNLHQEKISKAKENIDEEVSNDTEDNKEMVSPVEDCTVLIKDENVSTEKKEEEPLVEEKQSIKKKKMTKKVFKIKKKRKEEPKCESEESIPEEEDEKADNTLVSEKPHEVEKLKKIKKHFKKESGDSLEGKKLKKTVKRKKVIKKILKLRKRFPNKSPVGEVLNIAGFKWEVSALEVVPTVEPASTVEAEPMQLLPDSSVQEPLPEQSSEPVSFNQTTLESTTVGLTAYGEATPTSLPPPNNVPSWEPTPPPWEPPIPDPSLGTIIDSVNKLLNEPESAYTPLGLPSYSLADLQKAMGASDDEMAVLQQLGEASLQITSSEGSCSGSVKGCENDEWNGEKCIMDLDNQSSLQKQPESTASSLPEPTPEPAELVKEVSTQEWDWREKSPSVGSSSLLEAHQGKEVLCPSCSCHFMGFPALQRHLVKAHPSVGPKSKQKRGAGTTFTKTDLNRRMPLDSSQSPRLVCFSCQQILPADRMSLHLEQEHAISPEDVSKCSTLSGESHDGPVIGERLKSKMSSKLGDLLDRAVNNLLQAKHKPNNTLSGGAVELLTKLCAVRKREGSVKHRLHGARELLSKLQRQQDQKLLDEGGDDSNKILKAAKLFSCQICGLKFSLPSSRNKHEVLAHRSYRPAECEMVDEYENDWREAPSPPEIKGENGAETNIFPQCSDCGLSFDSIQDLMRHRVEDHTVRRLSVDASNTNTGCCPSPVPSSGGSRSLPESETEVAGVEADAAGTGRRRKSTRKLRLSQSGSKSVKERAEAALRELNHPRPRTDKRWIAAVKQKTADIYNFTDESL